MTIRILLPVVLWFGTSGPASSEPINVVCTSDEQDWSAEFLVDVDAGTVTVLETGNDVPITSTSDDEIVAMKFAGNQFDSYVFERVSGRFSSTTVSAKTNYMITGSCAPMP